MSTWLAGPSIYEINTWVWLADLRSRYGKSVSLGSVPPQEWNAIASFGFAAVWFMGVWERSPASSAISNRNSQLLEDFRRALPDLRPEDNVGSAYSVRRYVVDPRLGGTEGLARARQELANRGIKLLLDFVPNHVATDHPWVSDHPEYFVRGNADDLKNDPASYFEASGNVFAYGRDPYFPAWQDVLQLNAIDPGLRRAAVETLASIAGQCDGVRCDMAMLLVSAIFERTWGARAGQPPTTDYWREVIPSVKLRHPDFLFLAEAYWDMEWELQQQGFDFCYDKRLYDRLDHGNAESVRQHLGADLAFQAKLMRFLENHDEPRAALAFSPEKEAAAAVVISTLPGARLFHEGQFEGRRVRIPVFLARRPQEPVNETLRLLYENLLKAIGKPAFRDQQWSMCECAGWPDNASYQNLLAWTWRNDAELYLIAVNLSDQAVQARIFAPWPEFSDGKYLLTDTFSGARYEREADELLRSGLYVGLGPWGFHFLVSRRQHAVSGT
jgi:Alpha amylase, catalytic domain